MAREADALAHLTRRAVDVVLINPSASASRVMNIAKEARRLQPGVRVIAIAAQLTPEDIISALKSHVYACFALPVPAEELRGSIRQALQDDDWRSGIEVQSAVPHWIALRVSCRRVNAERLTQFMNELAGDLPESDRYQLDHGVPRGVAERDGARRRLRSRQGGGGRGRPDRTHARVLLQGSRPRIRRARAEDGGVRPRSAVAP